MQSSTGQVGPVVIAVLTYKRPDDLVALVPQLSQQMGSVDEQVSLLIVDNDPAAGARSSVEGFDLENIRYVHEPRPGIAAARNRALDEAAGAHLLIFIDDDERPAEGWLASLLTCYRRERCAAVVGSVVPDLVRVQDPWIMAGGFFVRQRHRTGTELAAASTANLLLDLHQVERLGRIRFDERFGATGGSDTMFTRTMVRRGGRIVWCDEAQVTDHIRVQRLSRRWVLQRHFRSGNAWSRIALHLEQGVVGRTRQRVALTLQGLARIAAGSLRVAVGKATRSMRHQARGSRTVARGTGLTLGAWGYVYTEYRRSKDQHAALSPQPPGP